MKVAAVCPIWKRPELTRFCLSQWATWDAPGIDFRFVIVGSEGYESMSLTHDTLGARSYYVEHPNKPLGAKFNAGIKAAEDMRPDYVMVMGSDMVVRDSIFADLPLRFGHPFVGVYDMHIYDVPTGTAYYWPGYAGRREGEVIGPCRFYSSRLLDSFSWSPYPASQNRDLDGGADAKLPKPRGIWSHDHALLNIKTPDNITPTRAYRNKVEVPTARLHIAGADFTQLCALEL